MIELNVTADEFDEMEHLGIDDEMPDVWEPLTLLLEMHPSYSKIFKKTMYSFYYGDGPLPVPHRHYLAIMAACRHQCEFLIELHKAEFVRCGGDANWLQDANWAPQKLRDFDELNRIIAHKPWQLQEAFHLQNLLQVSSPNNWSLSELVHGAVILSHNHSFCSFVHGVGLSTCSVASTNGVESKNSSPTTKSSSPSSTISNGRVRNPSSKNTNGVVVVDGIEEKNGSHQPKNGIHQKVEADTKVEELMACMRELSERHAQSSQEDKLQQFLDINVQSSEIVADVEISLGHADSVKATAYSTFTDDLQFCYTDFAKRNTSSASHTFKIHDYSWEDQGYGVINQLCVQVCNVVDDKFRIIQNLTYRTMGEHHDVDTTKYRTAVWNYIQSLYGIRHDDYDYAEVNRLLSRQMKIFVKTVGCYPERTTEALRASVMVGFQHSEKVHVNLLIFESRFQAELLYLLRALTRILV